MRRTAGAAALVSLSALACLDNPYGRPATVVDGTTFPPELRGNIASHRAYLRGERVALYLLGPGTLEVGRAIVLVGADGAELAPCATRHRDASGSLEDLRLDACQGAILPSLPDRADYSPFVRLELAHVPAGYALGSLRSRDEVLRAGLRLEDSGKVADLAVVDADASVADPTATIARLVGFTQGLELVYLDVARDLPLEGAEVAAMDLLVPEGMPAGGGGDLVRARPGEPGYSTLCNVVHYHVPEGFHPGDLQDASTLGPADLVPSDPPELLHCVVR